MNDERVFVYGTLRPGGSNHFRLAGANFFAAATVFGRLYQIDWYPGAVLDEAADEITGEIYLISPDMLDELDRFEGDEYRRVKTQARVQDGNTVSVWIWEWLGVCDETHRITSADWLSPQRLAEQ